MNCKCASVPYVLFQGDITVDCLKFYSKTENIWSNNRVDKLIEALCLPLETPQKRS